MPKTTATAINEASVRRYPLDQYTLIPLHKPRDIRTHRGVTRKIGKAPLDKNWTKAKYDSAKTVERCLSENRNIGVRLRSDQLVFDIDPRNGGDVSYQQLFAEYGIDETKFPKVETGSGGIHFYATKPKGFAVVDTLGDDFPGVEFKSKGRQVVTAGSIHPETGKLYKWDDDYPDIADAPPVPAKLLKLIAKPVLSIANRGGGQYDQQQIADMLEHLDPRDFADQTKWQRIMMACHHASNSDARSEFIEWSIGDPKYKSDAAIIGRRWDSCDTKKSGGLTYLTLQHYMRQAGAVNHIPKAAGENVADDEFADADALDNYTEGDESNFEDDTSFESPSASKSSGVEGDIDDDFETPSTLKRKKDRENDKQGKGLIDSEDYGTDALTTLQALNEQYTWIAEAGKPRIINKEYDPVLDRDVWIRMTPYDFKEHYCNRAIERDTSKLSKNASTTIKLGQAWCEWPRRNSRKGIVFYPVDNYQDNRYLNLWDGFRYQRDLRKTGSWEHLKELVFEITCDGNQESFEYVMRWMAFLVQSPWENPDVALIVRGAKGAGKGTLGNALCKMIGRHALHVSSGAHLTGRFNAHLQDLIFLFADEALLPYDKQAESTLKSLITEPTVNIEKKGVDLVQGKNFLHIYMASNEKWVVPASMDERRYYVLQASDKWIGNQKKFDAISDELNKDNGSGYAMMYHELANYELPERWNPRSFPQTAALVDQKLRGMSPLSTFFYNQVVQQHLDMEAHPRGGAQWPTQPIRFFVHDLKVAFTDHCRNIGANAGAMGKSNLQFLLQEVKEIFPTARVNLRDPIKERMDVPASPSDGRAPCVEIPSLLECREAFEKRLGGVPEWPTNKESNTPIVPDNEFD